MLAKLIDKLNKIPLWQRGIAVLVLCLVVVAAFYFVSWKALEEEVKAANAGLLQLDQEYKEQKAVADDLVTFQTNTKKLEEDLKIALTQLPQEKEIPSLLRDIYTLGKKSGVIFKSFQPQAEVGKQGYFDVPVKMSFTSSYHEMAVFFDRIGKLSRIVNISEINIASSSGRGKDGMELTVDCLATTFMFAGNQK